MTSQEFQHLQQAAGMKNHDVERMCGVSDQTVINWRKGYSRVPLAVQTLIRMKAEQSRTKV